MATGMLLYFGSRSLLILRFEEPHILLKSFRLTILVNGNIAEVPLTNPIL